MDNIGKIDLVSHKQYSKSAILMRMSDDVMRSLEKYALNQNGSSSKLTIKFDDSSGVIKVPIDGNEEVFSFSITGSTASRDSTYCVQETENRALETVALVQKQKINIKPSVNSFEKTRSKISNQRKINLCREVDLPNSLPKAKKVIVKRSSTVTEVPNSVTINGNEKKKLIANKSSDILSQPLRKRIIHMLALKPCKKSDVRDRLIKEGITDHEKSKIITVLYKVGFPKENEIFHLEAKLWEEVEDDWRFYSPEDAAIVQRRKQEAFQTNVNPEPKNPPIVLPSKKQSLVDEIIASSMPIPKKQKISVKEENPGLLSVAQHIMRNSTPKNCSNPTAESKESNNQIISPPSSKKKRKKNRRKRKKNKTESNSEVVNYLPSTVINNTNPVLKDSGLVQKITSPPVAPSSTVDDRTLDANRVSLNNSDSFPSIKADSCFIQKTKAPFLKAIQNDNTSQIVGKPALSVVEFQNLDSFHSKSEETHEKGIFSSTVKELTEKVPKQGEFVDCLRHSEHRLSRTQDLSPASSSSRSTSLSFIPKSEETREKGILASTVKELTELVPKQGEFVPTDCLRQSESHLSRTQGLSSASSSSRSTSLSLFVTESEEIHEKGIHPSTEKELTELVSKQGEFVPTDSVRKSHGSRSQELSLPSAFSVTYSASSSRSILYKMYKILTAFRKSQHRAKNFKMNFCKISSLEQRNRYEELFDLEYPTYIEIRKSVTIGIKRMNELEANLKTFKEGTQEYEAALLKLCQAYELYLQNSQFGLCNRLVYQYQKRLTCLKSLICEFDNEQNGNLSSDNSE